jgi:hypothetical protein
MSSSTSPEATAKTVPLDVEGKGQFTLPRVAITFCTQCRWMLRAAYVSSIGSLVCRDNGLFVLWFFVGKMLYA